MLRAFQETFLTNIFLNEEFYALQSCLALFKLVLKYHAPKVTTRLDQCDVTPEMYAVPWFLTYFAKVITHPELILTFWDEIARRRDVA